MGMTDTNCPKCGRDIFDLYEEHLSGNSNKYIRIENYCSFFDGE